MSSTRNRDSGSVCLLAVPQRLPAVIILSQSRAWGVSGRKTDDLRRCAPRTAAITGSLNC
eukprot:2628344-Rhodomonas_salina.1